MRLLRFAVLLVTASVSLLAETKPPLSKVSLSQEQVEIYRDFLKSYNNGSTAKLNISSLTRPFTQESWQSDSCLKTLKLSSLDGQSVHILGRNVFEGFQINLIDPTKHREADPGEAIRHGEEVDSAVEHGFAAGVFTYSEIVFDSSHTHAVFSYSFHCGSLCGRGGVVVYELSDRKWIASKKQLCGSWIS